MITLMLKRVIVKPKRDVFGNRYLAGDKIFLLYFEKWFVKRVERKLGLQNSFCPRYKVPNIEFRVQNFLFFKQMFPHYLVTRSWKMPSDIILMLINNNASLQKLISWPKEILFFMMILLMLMIKKTQLMKAMLHWMDINKNWR